jgi:hypothetical protein
MTSSKAKLFILINLLSVIKVSLLETVHFTNSPKKILKANNYTTYKVEVPNGGDPITIIEANVPLINKRIKFNDVENAKYPIMHNHDNNIRKNQVIDLESSLSMTVTPNNNHNNNNYNDEYENLAADEESVSSMNGNYSPERYHDKNSMKTVYSPELLQKFLKDYANKVQAATASTESSQSHFMSNESEMSADKVKDKYESIETDEQDEGNRRVSSASTDDNEASELNDIQQRKNYRPNGSYSNHHHPYNKNNGWVTLDAVPWSKSKVSRWQSNKHGNYNYQNGNNYNSQRPPNRPSSNNYDYDYNSANVNDNDDYYGAPKPSRPTYHNNQFYGGSSHQHHSRPTQDSWQQQSIQTYHVSNHGHHNYGPSSSSSQSYYDDHRPNKPYQPDIITDNRPSNFPQHGDEQRPYSRPSSNENGYGYHGGNYYNSHKEGTHPASYPTSGM